MSIPDAQQRTTVGEFVLRRRSFADGVRKALGLPLDTPDDEVIMVAAAAGLALRKANRLAEQAAAAAAGPDAWAADVVADEAARRRGQ